MAKVIYQDDTDAPIKVLQHGNNSFTVAYGESVKHGLDYAGAARELGEAIFHALACKRILKQS